MIAAKKFRACQVHHVLEKYLPVFSPAGLKHGPEPAAPSQPRANLMGITYRGRPNAAMNSSFATSSKPCCPGRRGKIGWQSNGVSVMGPQSAAVLYCDRAGSLDGARRDILDSVERKMVKTQSF